MGEHPGHSFRGNQWTGTVSYESGVGRANFDAALRHVQEYYPHLLHESVGLIVFTARMDRDVHGTFHFRPAPKLDARGKVVRDDKGRIIGGGRGKAGIRVTARNAPTREFVATLVHELTHARQWREGRPHFGERLCEAEAYAAGHAASTKYDWLTNPTRHVR